MNVSNYLLIDHKRYKFTQLLLQRIPQSKRDKNEREREREFDDYRIAVAESNFVEEAAEVRGVVMLG